MKIAYAVPMTWACGGILAPFRQIHGLMGLGHSLVLCSPKGESVDWFPLRAPIRSLEDPAGLAAAGRFDGVVFVGDSFRHHARFDCERKFILLQGKDHLLATGTARRALLEGYAQPGFRFLAVSSWLAEFVKERFPGRRVDVVGNGVDLDLFFPDTAVRSVPRILIEGNLPDANKNVLDALEAVARMKHYQKLEVWALARRFSYSGPLVDRVFLDPPQDEIPGIYRGCDILLKTSTLEGFGLPHLEARASGCVPVTYASGGVLDFCRHEENSLIAGVGNLPLLVWHGLRCVADANLRGRLRAGALATAREYGWDRVAAALEAAMGAE